MEKPLKKMVDKESSKFMFVVQGDLADLAYPHSFALFGKKGGGGPSASTHGPERRKEDRPVCDCDDD